MVIGSSLPIDGRSLFYSAITHTSRHCTLTSIFPQHLSDHTHSRYHLCNEIWGNKPEKVARISLMRNTWPLHRSLFSSDVLLDTNGMVATTDYSTYRNREPTEQSTQQPFVKPSYRIVGSKDCQNNTTKSIVIAGLETAIDLFCHTWATELTHTWTTTF